MPGDAGTAFVTLVPKVSPGFGAAANAQLGGPLGAIGSKLATVGGALAAGVVAGAAVGGAAIVGFANKLDEGTKSIRVATGATGAGLEALGQNFRNIVGSVAGAEVSDFATAIGELNTRTGAGGPLLEELATQAVRLAEVTGEDLNGIIEGTTRVFGDWGIAAEDQAGAMDYLFKVSQSTGIGVTDLSRKLVQFGAPMRQVGFTIEESAALFGKFEKEGVNAELVMGSIRQALGKMAREGEPAVETFKRVTGEIAAAGDASEANAIALELFGARAGPDMAAAIREGRFEVGELLSDLEASPETLKSAADESATFGERFSAAMQRLGVALEPIGKAVISFAEDTVIPAVEKVVDGIIGLKEVFDAEGFAGVWDRISAGAAELWPKIRAWLLETGASVLEWLKTEGPVWGEALLGMVREATDWLLEAIPPFLENLGRLIGAGLEWLIAEGLPMLGEWLVNTGAPALWEWIESSYAPYLAALGELLIKFGAWLVGDALPFLASHVGEWLGALLGWLWNDAIPALGEGLLTLLEALGEWLTGTAFPWLLEKGPEWLAAFFGWLVDAIPHAFVKLNELGLAITEWIITTAVPWLIEKGIALAGALLSFIATAIIEAPGKLLELFTTITGWLITDAAPWLLEKGLELQRAILGWIADAALAAPGKLAELFGAITDWLVNTAPGLIADAASGLWDGIVDAFKAVMRTFLNAWNSIDIGFTVPDIPGVPHRGESFDIVPDVTIPAVFLAEGGTALRDINAVVGEEGEPELVQLPRGGRVTPLRDLVDAVPAGSGGLTIEALNVENPVDATADETVAAIDAKLGWTLTNRLDR